MKVTSKNYDGKFYIKLGRKYIPLEQTVEYFESIEKENEQLKQQIVGKENEFKYFSNSFQSKIKELKQQIEQMKCCGNCKHRNTDEAVETCRKLKNYTLIKGSCECWEFAE